MTEYRLFPGDVAADGRPLEGLPPLPWHTETAAMLEGLAAWVDDELAGGAPAKWVAHAASNAARFIASRPVIGPSESPPSGSIPQLPAGAPARGWLALNVRRLKDASIFRGDGWWNE